MSIDVRELFTSFKKLPEIRELQRSIENYDMRSFPQHVLHVLLCTSTVHDQSENICIQGYLRILWIQNTKSSKVEKVEERGERKKG